MTATARLVPHVSLTLRLDRVCVLSKRAVTIEFQIIFILRNGWHGVSKVVLVAILLDATF